MIMQQIAIIDPEEKTKACNKELFFTKTHPEKGNIYLQNCAFKLGVIVKFGALHIEYSHI